MKDLLIVAAIATIVYALIGSWVFGVLTGLAEESGEDPGLRWLIVLACFVWPVTLAIGAGVQDVLRRTS